jgi:membrane-associated phospholipid phosphatase
LVDTPSRSGRGETIAGSILLVLTLLAGVVFSRYPGLNRFDRWGFSVVPRSVHSWLLIKVADLGTPTALAVGSILAALVVVTRDRWRAAACLCGPAIAVVLVDWVVKPAVGRRFEGVLTFPSGTVTVIASLSAAWALAVPRWLRWFVVAVGALVTAVMVIAVVGLRWHYLSDAVGGVTLGVGTVLALDGVLHLVRGARWAAPDRCAGQDPDEGTG